MREKCEREIAQERVGQQHPGQRDDQSTALSQTFCLLCVEEVRHGCISLYSLFLSHTLRCILKELCVTLRKTLFQKLCGLPRQHSK